MQLRRHDVMLGKGVDGVYMALGGDAPPHFPV
jgi:hypothetical protein